VRVCVPRHFAVRGILLFEIVVVLLGHALPVAILWAATKGVGAACPSFSALPQNASSSNHTLSKIQDITSIS
jgi:hypothetical protein